MVLDLTGAPLERIFINGLDLQNIRILRGRFAGSNIFSKNLTGADFLDTDFSDTLDLAAQGDDSTLPGVIRTQISNVTLVGANLSAFKKVLTDSCKLRE